MCRAINNQHPGNDVKILFKSQVNFPELKRNVFLEKKFSFCWKGGKNGDYMVVCKTVNKKDLEFSTFEKYWNVYTRKFHTMMNTEACGLCTCLGSSQNLSDLSWNVHPGKKIDFSNEYFCTSNGHDILTEFMKTAKGLEWLVQVTTKKFYSCKTIPPSYSDKRLIS